MADLFVKHLLILNLNCFVVDVVDSVDAVVAVVLVVVVQQHFVRRNEVDPQLVQRISSLQK